MHIDFLARLPRRALCYALARKKKDLVLLGSANDRKEERYRLEEAEIADQSILAISCLEASWVLHSGFNAYPETGNAVLETLVHQAY